MSVPTGIRGPAGSDVESASMTPSPEDVVQRQLDAYNARDLDAWLRTYAPDAQQFALHGERLAAGHAEIARA